MMRDDEGWDDFPVTDAVARSTLALPFSRLMPEEQVEYVCGTLGAAIASAQH